MEMEINGNERITAFKYLIMDSLPWLSLNSLILSVLSGASERSVSSMHFIDSFSGISDFKKAMFACAIIFSI